MKVPYTYIVLRYVHDVATAEFANAGVVVYCPSQRFLGAKCRSTFGRLGRIFPDINGDSVKHSLRYIEDRVDELGRRLASELALENWPNDVQEIVSMILQHDDSSLQWSEVGGGLTESANKTLDALWDRLIVKYDDKSSVHRRSDDEIWRSFKKEFDALQVTKYLNPKVISTDDDEVKFEHAWKNGSWHCVQPVSFDLANNDSIREKAHKWLGQITSLGSSASDPFQVYFLVGAPGGRNLKKGFDNALRVLGKAPNAQIVEESHARAFSEQISKQIENHHTNSGH